MHKNLLWKIRGMLLFFIVALVLSGITAFPLRAELHLLNSCFGAQTAVGETWPDLVFWLEYIQKGLDENAEKYPFMAYGTDWLAFAHLIIAVAFLGPLRDPVKNIWVIHFGMIACILVIPLAFICGTVREIPLLWKLIDCSFGVGGIIPLIFVHRWTKKYENLTENFTDGKQNTCEF
ncbi:MAG: hypothetical protein Q4C96_10830 [Planctomycetia bacterium]|nr:hypothetical protein [Planctomycetia bacterium]